MAVGPLITTVLSNIPWGQVVDNAPRIAEAAARLWNTGRKSRKAPGEDEAEGAAREASLPARVAALEGELRGLREELQASSELIKALAEQNSQLVQTLERERRRLTRLAIGGTVVAVILAAMTIALTLRF